MRVVGKLIVALVVVTGCTAGMDSSGDPGDGGDPHAHGGDPSTGSDPGPAGDSGQHAHCPSTITDIKTGSVAIGDSACLTGVMVTAVGAGGVFVVTPDTESFAGLFLSTSDSAAIGDTVNVGVATVQSVSGELRLDSPTLVVTSTGDSPEPEVVAASDLATDSATDEQYEAMLVFVPTVTVVTASAHSFTVSDDGGEDIIEVGGFLSPSVLNVNPGDMFDSITGIWRATGSGYELEPRGEFDLQASFEP